MKELVKEGICLFSLGNNLIVEDMLCEEDGTIYHSVPVFYNLTQVAAYKTDNALDSIVTEGSPRKVRITIELLED